MDFLPKYFTVLSLSLEIRNCIQQFFHHCKRINKLICSISVTVNPADIIRIFFLYNHNQGSKMIFRGHLVQPLLLETGLIRSGCSGLCRVLNACKDRVSTTSVGNPFRYLTTLTVSK